MGGLGKTQIAVEYAFGHRRDYKAVFWVRADSQLALSTGFVEIARLLDLPKKDAQNPDDAVRAVVRWLEDNSGWLLIFDNADTPDLLNGFRPRNAKGHVLLTSRAQVFHALGIVKAFEIDVMLPEEALKFLFTRTGRDEDNAVEKEAAGQLALELGYLPLALEQAGAFITARHARLQDYLTAYRKRRGQLLNKSRPVTGNYPDSIATTWAINFSEIEKTSEAASDLLRASAFLSPDRIPLELITEGRSELGAALSGALADVDEDPLALNEVLEPLTRYSFIRLDGDSQTYSIHRLVQEVLKDGMVAEAQRLWAERTIRALNQAFPEPDFQHWTLCERLLPHATAAARLIEKWNITFGGAGLLLNQGAVYCHYRGQYDDAESLYQRSLTISEKVLGPDHPNVARVLNNLAALYEAQRKYAETEALHKRALAIFEAVLEPDHPSLATSLNNLAELYRVQGKYNEAEPLFKRSLEISEKTLDHPGVARSLNNLALLYDAQGKYAEAEPLYQRALASREELLGPNHPDVAVSLNNLAGLYHTQGKYAEAEPLYKRSLAIWEKALGPDHPDVAASLNNSAMLYRVQGKYIEAEPLFKRALAIWENALGVDYPDLATVLENYAVLLRATNRDAEAEEMGTRAAAIRSEGAQQDSAE